MLIEEHYPWFLETYDGMDEPIMRADAVRMEPSASGWLSDFSLHSPSPWVVRNLLALGPMPI